MKSILFYTEPPLNFVLKEKNKIRDWLNIVSVKEGFEIKHLNYIFCNDEYLHKINVEYLNHDTYTDIITFDQSEIKNTIEGDVFISKERVKENSKQLDIFFSVELKRVMVHGLLHLCGYLDKTKKEEMLMRERENYYLGLM